MRECNNSIMEDVINNISPKLNSFDSTKIFSGKIVPGKKIALDKGKMAILLGRFSSFSINK